MLQTQTPAAKGHFLVLVLGDAVQTGLELKHSVLEAEFPFNVLNSTSFIM